MKGLSYLKGDYGVGMLLLSPDKDTREESLKDLQRLLTVKKKLPA